MSSQFHYATDADGVATITWDQPETSMNVMNGEAFAELDAHLDTAFGDDAVKGVIITSAKKDFAGGMDLNVLAKMKADAGDDPAAGIMKGLMDIHAILRKIERNNMDAKTNKGGKPVAWASPGTSAGIGTEIALSCHRRFLADNPKVCDRAKKFRKWNSFFGEFPLQIHRSFPRSVTPFFVDCLGLSLTQPHQTLHQPR